MKMNSRGWELWFTEAGDPMHLSPQNAQEQEAPIGDPAMTLVT